MTSSAMVTVDPPLLHPPTSCTRATPARTPNRVKLVAWDSSSRSPRASSRATGPAKIRSITPVAGVPGRTGRRTGVKNGGVLATNRGSSRK